MDNARTGRRVAALAAHLNALPLGGAPSEAGAALAPETVSGVLSNPTAAAGDLGAALQALLDHDNPRERAALKEIMRDPLFTPRWNISVPEER
jgi:hypothetical protein